MRICKNLYVCALLVAFSGLTMQAEVKLPAVFSDNMVLQQQSSVAVWGWTKPHAGVRVTGSWNNKSYSARSDEKGFWKLNIQTPAASYTPYTLTVSDGKAIVLKNVLIGEVWICSGQSNMEMQMRGYGYQPIEGGPEAIAHSDNPGIRCFTARKVAKATPQDDCVGIWEVAGPQTVPGFTATGYFFGRFLNQVLNVPVGLLHVSWGGTIIEAWMTPNALKDFPEKVVPAPDAEINQNKPTALYNGMIHPLVGYGIRGAIWYQGESNRNEPALYTKLFDNMVRGWRSLWGIGEFPFYYCQIAPFNYGGGLNSGFIREAQAKCLATTPNTGMAVLMDSDSPNSIHPPQKKDAGERMALWALAKTYGMEKMHYRSPEFKKLIIEGRMAIVEFEMFGSTTGLTVHDASGKPAASPSQPGRYEYSLSNFLIAGEDKRFHKATAVLASSKVYLFSPAVANPVAVRYCFDDTSLSEIFSVEGDLPVSSFRTDEW